MPIKPDIAQLESRRNIRIFDCFPLFIIIKVRMKA